MTDRTSEPRATASELGDIERQVERGSLFTHTALSENAERVTEVESFLYGLVNLLVERGAIDHDALGEAARIVRGELDARGETSSPGVVLRVDANEPEIAPVAVNCEERLHVCHAVCCRLHFALSASEIESGAVKWDLGRPYHIRHTPEGNCTHNDGATHRCRIYADRPGACRRYSCASDARIWTDFETMTLNTAWIDANLHGSAPRLAQAHLIAMDAAVTPSAGTEAG